MIGFIILGIFLAFTWYIWFYLAILIWVFISEVFKAIMKEG